MKNKIIIIAVVLISLTVVVLAVKKGENTSVQPMEKIAANSNLKEEEAALPVLPAMPEFHYEVGSRFVTTITKSELNELTHFSDLIGEEHAERIVFYKSVIVTVLGDTREDEVEEIGTQGMFTEAQKSLLQSSVYGTDILIAANYREKLSETGKPENGAWTPYLTVVPEKQAEYMDGKEVLLDYLKENAAYYTLGIDQKVLRSARIRFKVTKEGKVIDVALDHTSGYKEIDWVMIDLINDLPKNWIPAQNAKGENVSQELVFSFGARGC
ncbi:MAG: hypothetical protein K0U54_08295 [Bacteroidetes bacterium]|nr:hypothetical protein [Bacteroidota bacterium]